jgi:molecular chaperone GrpE (heat shock protein)
MNGGSEKAKRYRERAEEARKDAAKMQGEDFKRTLIEVAESYERLADRIEASEARRKR